MNNLTQTTRDAKQANLNNQQSQMIATYENADKNERSAIIRQISRFSVITKGDEKAFWLKFRQTLEKLNK
jgi:hypothetical protein